MPTDATVAAAAPKARALDNPRARRILRFTIGVTLATAYSTYINWPFSFLLPALVIPFLALPIPSAPSLRYGLWITTKLIAFAGLGAVLMLPLHSHQLFGFAVVALILFVNFYLQAEGKVTGLNAMIVIVGITLVPAFGAELDGCGRRVRERHVAVCTRHVPRPLGRLRRGARRRVSRPAQCTPDRRHAGGPGHPGAAAGAGAAAAVRVHAEQRQQHSLPDRLLPAGHDRAACAPCNRTQADRRPDHGHAHRRHRRTDHVVAHEAVAVVVLVRAGDGAVLACSTRRASSATDPAR